MSNVQMLPAMRLNLKGFGPSRKSTGRPKLAVSIGTRVKAKVVAPPSPAVLSEVLTPVESAPPATAGDFVLPAVVIAGIASLAASLDSIFLSAPAREVLAQTEPWSPFADPAVDDDGWANHHHHQFIGGGDSFHHESPVHDDAHGGFSHHDYMAASRGD
ncbi:hypothetical protein ACFOFO_16300 [Undibacterium arcticum]|uniref:Uncharacterized protein n=2 Tax=Undibacterium arcticum TaxID=1762892 RepID=A0ABV7F3D7_9BURK